MGRIEKTFRRLGKVNEAALIPYVTVGYPSLDMTRRIVPIIARQGADLIELGVPFSDPMADGATVQHSSQVALENGITLADCLSVAAEARRSNDVPLLLMSYYNPLHAYGVQRIAEDCARSGVDGLIVPDLPPEEAGELKAACEELGIDLIFLVAPTSTDERLQKVAQIASGFIYCVSLTGVTGARVEMGDEVESLVSRLRNYTDLPLAVGFGIGRPEHVERVARIADGAVVGSALINLMDTGPEEEVILTVSDFIRDMKAAASKPTP